MSKQTLLNQIRKLQARLESLHDTMNDKYGAAHQNTQEAMMCFALAFACQCDIEQMLEGEE